MSEPFMVTKKRARELPAPDLSKRSKWLIAREDRVQKGIDGTVDMLEALEEIRQKPEEYRRLGYERFNDYTSARWGKSADRIWQLLKWHKDWTDVLVPALQNRQVSVPPEPPEGAGRAFTKLAKADKPAAAEAIAKESAATGRKVDGKVIKSGIRKSGKGKPEKKKPTEPESRAKSWSMSDRIQSDPEPTKPEPAAETKEFYDLKHILPKELLPAMLAEVDAQCSILQGTYLKVKRLVKKLQIAAEDQYGSENTVLEGQEQDIALKEFQLPQLTYHINKLRKIVSDPDVRAISGSDDSRAIIEDAIEVIEQQCDVLDNELEDIGMKKDNFEDEDSLPGRRDDAEERAEALGQFLDLKLNTKDLREALEPWQDADLQEL